MFTVKPVGDCIYLENDVAMGGALEQVSFHLTHRQAAGLAEGLVAALDEKADELERLPEVDVGCDKVNDDAKADSVQPTLPASDTA